MYRRTAASAARTRAQDTAAILVAVVASAGEQQHGCPNCPPGYDCEAGNYLMAGTGHDEPHPADDGRARS